MSWFQGLRFLNKVKENFGNVARVFLHVVLPERCCYCGCVRNFRRESTIFKTQYGEDFHLEWKLCVDCYGLFRPEALHVCKRCGRFLPRLSVDVEDCYYCRKSHFWFDRVIALERYEDDWRKVALLMKKTSGVQLMQTFATMLYTHRYFSITSVKADLIIPVPMHPFFHWVRGVNNTEILAACLSRLLKIPTSRKLVKCQRLTLAQRAVKMHERRNNVRNMFAPIKSPANRTRWLGKRVIIVDDVITTGSTVNELARILKKEFGVTDITVVVLFRARGVEHKARDEAEASSNASDAKKSWKKNGNYKKYRKNRK